MSGSRERLAMDVAHRQRAASDADRRDSPPPADAGARRARRHRVVGALARAGALLLVGSDAPGTYAVPGFACVERIDHVANPAGVTVLGVWLPRAELDRRIAAYRAE